MNQIHPTAVIHPTARLHGDVDIGPYVVVEADVSIGPRSIIGAHSVIKERTILGSGNRVAEHVILGGPPQHLQVTDRYGHLELGNGNVVREHVTIHAALVPGNKTLLGDRNYIMAGAHVAHDCVVGHHTILANNVMLAGHVLVEDFAYLSGAAGSHQMCRIGAHAMVGGQAHLKADVPPYVLVDGNSTLAVGINHVGLRRRGFSREDLAAIKRAYRIVYDADLTWEERLASLEASFPTGPAARFAAFLRGSERGIVRSRKAVKGTRLRVVAGADLPQRKAG